MPAKKRPSFLKKQKEQARVARATQKREAKRLRKQERLQEATEPLEPEIIEQPAAGSEELPN